MNNLVGQAILPAAAFQAALSGHAHSPNAGSKPAAARIGCPTSAACQTLAQLSAFALFCLLLAAPALCAQSGAAGADWPTYGGAYSAWRYSALDQVNRGNVQKLAPAWVFQTGDYENGLQATPIVLDGVLYLSTSNRSEENTSELQSL